MGSGTTAIAAHREGRHFIGLELDEKYVQLAQKKVEAEQQQLTLPLTGI